MALSKLCTKCGFVRATANRAVCVDCYRNSQREYAKAKAEAPSIRLRTLGPVIYDWTGLTGVGRCIECAGWSAFALTLDDLKESVRAHIARAHMTGTAQLRALAGIRRRADPQKPRKASTPCSTCGVGMAMEQRTICSTCWSNQVLQRRAKVKAARALAA